MAPPVGECKSCPLLRRSPGRLQRHRDESTRNVWGVPSERHHHVVLERTSNRDAAKALGYPSVVILASDAAKLLAVLLVYCTTLRVTNHVEEECDPLSSTAEVGMPRDCRGPVDYPWPGSTLLVLGPSLGPVRERSKQSCWVTQRSRVVP